jgi:hypothetical protein
MMEIPQEGPCQHCPELFEIQDQLNHWKNELTFWKVLQEQKEKKHAR